MGFQPEKPGANLTAIREDLIHFSLQHFNREVEASPKRLLVLNDTQCRIAWSKAAVEYHVRSANDDGRSELFPLVLEMSHGEDVVIGRYQLFKLHEIRSVLDILTQIVKDHNGLAIITIPMLCGARTRIAQVLTPSFGEQEPAEIGDQPSNRGGFSRPRRSEKSQYEWLRPVKPIKEAGEQGALLDVYLILKCPPSATLMPWRLKGGSGIWEDSLIGSIDLRDILPHPLSVLVQFLKIFLRNGQDLGGRAAE
jgi:hypothetical protein